MRFELFKDALGLWRFRMLAKNNKIIAQSESYKCKANALKTINLLRESHLWAVIEK